MLDILAGQPSRVVVAGPKPQKERRWADLARQALVKGTLSAVLLAQSLQAFGAPPAAPVLPQANQAAAVVIDSTSRPEIFDPQGILTGTAPYQAFHDWRDAGVADAHLLAMSESWVLSQSPIVAATPEALDSARALAEQTAPMGHTPTAEQAAILAESSSVPMLEAQGFLPKDSSLANHRIVAEEGYGFAAAFQFWERMGMAHHDLAPENQSGESVSLAQAAHALQEAVQETGLASLRVPLPMWESPEAVADLAKDIKTANQELQQLTGWDGQVLGMKGRVHWVAGSAYDTAFAQSMPDGSIHIQATTDDFLHEWTHGLEMAMAHDMGWESQGNMPAMLSHLHAHGQEASPIVQPLLPDGSTQDPPHMAHAWAQAAEGLERVSQQQPNGWFSQMDERADRIAQGLDDHYSAERQDYPRYTHERMAYSLAAYGTTVLGENSVLGHRLNTSQGQQGSIYGPGAQEAGAQAVVWQSVFQDLKDGWWASPQAASQVLAQQPAQQAPIAADVEVSFPSLSGWRQDRPATSTQDPAPVQAQAARASRMGH